MDRVSRRRDDARAGNLEDCLIWRVKHDNKIFGKDGDPLGIYIGADRFYARSSDGVFPVHIAVLGQATEGFSRPAYVSVALGEKVVTGFQKLD